MRSGNQIIQKRWEKQQYMKLKRSQDELDQIVNENYCFYIKTKNGCCAYTGFWRQTFLQVTKFNKTDTFYIFPLNTNLSLLTKEKQPEGEDDKKKKKSQ